MTLLLEVNKCSRQAHFFFLSYTVSPTNRNHIANKTFIACEVALGSWWNSWGFLVTNLVAIYWTANEVTHWICCTTET